MFETSFLGYATGSMPEGLAIVLEVYERDGELSHA